MAGVKKDDPASKTGHQIASQGLAGEVAPVQPEIGVLGIPGASVADGRE